MRRAIAVVFSLAALLCAGATLATPVQFRAAESAYSASGDQATSTIKWIGHGSLASANGSSVSPSLPTHEAGDFLICLVTRASNTNGITPSWTTSSNGWNEIYNTGRGGHSAAAYYKFSTGTESNPTFERAGGGSGALISRCSAFRGVRQDDPFQLTDPTTRYTSNDDIIRTYALTLKDNSDVYLLLAGHFNGGSELDDDEMPSGWGADYYYDYRDDNRGIALFHRSWTNANVPSVTIEQDSNVNTHGAMIALRPAVTSPPPGSLVINKPAGTTEGDVMIASIAVARGSGNNALAINAPAGWIRIREINQSTSNRSQLATYYRVAGENEPASYTWAFPGNDHIGAVGGIASFIGVDTTDPIHDERGWRTSGNNNSCQDGTSSSTSHCAPSVDAPEDGMLVTVHEYASSRLWNAPSGMAQSGINISSRTPNSGSGISIGLFYEERSVFGDTGTRIASTGGNSDRGAAQSLSLRPISIPVACVDVDNFDRGDGPPGPNWIVSNSGGSFGNPVIHNKRLRLTDATGNVATMATLQRLFPGAGNRIEIEFDYFAYGGSGADGIAVVLSDSAVTPTPGGYGGALGYAPKIENGNHPGFAGGWLGVGIDEFGNFSSTELGKTGGPGQRADSVSVRGSGSGMNNYRYHAGTNTLSPGVDVSGSTAGPGHTYRIVVDHSNSANAWVSVQRKTGANFETLIERYDAKAQTGQAAVPEKWILSWTGSTGGSTNVHEIDNLRICATNMETIASADHYAIQHATSGVNCQPENVTITAKNASNAAVSANGATITVTARRVAGTPAANRGDWILVAGSGALDNGTADDGVATYTFGPDEQQVTLALKNTHLQTVNIDVDGQGVTEGSGAGASEPGYNQNLTFAPSGFRFTNGANPPSPFSIPTQTAGVTSATYALQAIRTDTNTGACVGAFADNADVAVDLAFQCNNPATCQSGQLVSITNNGSTSTIAANPGSGVSNYSARSLRFGPNSQALFTLVYPDVGQITLHASHNIPLANGSPSDNLMLGSSNAFVVKPYDFRVSDIKTTAGGAENPEAEDAGGPIFVRAGESFSATVTSINAQGDATPNYGKESTPEGVKLTSALVGGLGLVANPALANADAFSTFDAGSATGTAFSWNEVGIVRLTAEVADGNYLGTGNVVGTPSANVGRFIPDHFKLSGGALKNRSDAGCTPDSAFTYMDEPMLLKYSLAASNTSGGTTQNYQGAFAKLNVGSAAAHGFGVRDTASSSTLTSRLDVLSVTGNWSGGVADIDAAVSIARSSAPDGPYNALRIGIAPVDGDGVRLATATLDLDVDGNSSNDHAQIGETTRIRFGRLRLFNALGSERLPLAMPMQLEYWNGTAFVVNSDDNCTTLARSTIAMAPDSGLAPCKTAFNEASIAFNGGKATPVLAAPTPAHGSVDLRVNLGSGSGDHCPAVNGSATAATSAIRSYLQGRWNGADYDDDPVARATFGVYGAQVPKRFIYSRENY